MAGRHRLAVARHRGARLAKARARHHKGHPISEETRKKIQAALKGRKHPHKGHRGKRGRRA